MDNPCQGNCGKTLIRDVKCRAPGSNLSLDEKFFCGPGSNAGPKPDESKTCPPCGQWEKRLVGTCEYDPLKKSCRPNEARQAYTWECSVDGGCEGQKPDDGFDPCTMQCLPWQPFPQTCLNPGQEATLCDLGNAERQVVFRCTGDGENQDVCFPEKPDDFMERCELPQCVDWVVQPRYPEAPCRKIADISQEQTCGTGYEYVTAQCPVAGHCDPRKEPERQKICRANSACVWVPLEWRPQE
jgi:hypothetical protein